MQEYNTSSERLFKRIVVRVCESKPNNNNNNNNNNNKIILRNACCNARETHPQYNCIYQEAVILT